MGLCIVINIDILLSWYLGPSSTCATNAPEPDLSGAGAPDPTCGIGAPRRRRRGKGRAYAMQRSTKEPQANATVDPRWPYQLADERFLNKYKDEKASIETEESGGKAHTMKNKEK
jgi:hypothetical protein